MLERLVDVAARLRVDAQPYVDVATVTGNERFVATSPFEVVVLPALLID